MAKPRHKLLALLMAALVLAAFTMYRDMVGNAAPSDILAGRVPVKVTARALPLLVTEPDTYRAGALRYRAGWALTADNDHFGGFSGLVVTETGKLTAISDRGDWLEADFVPDAREPIRNATMRPFTEAAQGKRKSAFDSESIIAEGDGFLVSFEADHRLLSVAADGTVQLSALSAMTDFDGLADNRGIEAITFVNGQLLVLPEAGVDTVGRLRGQLVTEAGTKPVYFRPPTNYSPTDAATMKNGDVLVLLRRYSLFDGVSAKLVRVRGTAIKPGATIEGEELVHLDPPYTVDNMEGLDVVERAGEPPTIFLISDDNFRDSQRTLLLVFTLESP